MAQHQVIGTGFALIPAGLGLDDAAYPCCGVGAGVGFGLADLNNPQTTDRTVDIGLDRQSFLSRGRPRWLVPDAQMNPLYAALAQKLNG